MSVGDKCCSNGMHGCHNNNNSSSNIPLATPAITTTTAAAIMTTHMGHTKAFGAQFDVKRARTEGKTWGKLNTNSRAWPLSSTYPFSTHLLLLLLAPQKSRQRWLQKNGQRNL